jgi:predicted anti-sigma-YlaC factor YlaD
MSLRHLNEEEIQEYLDGNLSRRKALLVERHLKTCLFCQERLNQYKSLYVALADDEDFELSRDFAKSVTSKLPAITNAPARANYVNTFFTILGSIIGMALIFYYVGLKPLSGAISHTLLSQYEFGSTLVASMKSFLVSLNGNTSFWVLAGLTLLVIVALDHLLFHPKFGRISF